MVAGQVYSVTVTMQNTGNMSWSEATRIRLGGVGEESGDAARFGPVRINLPNATIVPPGHSFTFVFNMTAPAAGTYGPQYRMIWEGQQWFGQTLTRNVTVSNSTPDYDARYVSDTIPSTIANGSYYVLEICMNNTGSQTWYTSPGAGNPQVQMNQVAGQPGILAFSTGNPQTVSPNHVCYFYGGLYAPSTPGVYQVQCQLSRQDNYQYFGQIVNKTITVTAPPSGLPAAGFNVSSNIGYVPLTVQFNDNSTGAPTAWAWNFGDGTPNSTLQNPSHTYNIAGAFNVTLTVSNALGSNTTMDGSVFVYVPPPVAGFYANVTSGYAPLTVQFNDNSTGAPTGWWWDFGDNGSSMLQNPVHTFASAGIYNVTLTATNDGGSDTGIRTAYINVSALVPSASLVSNTIPTAMDNYVSYGVSVTMANTGSMPWTHEGGFALSGVNNDSRLFGNTPISVPAGTVVQPGQQYTFSFTMTAPA